MNSNSLFSLRQKKIFLFLPLASCFLLSGCLPPMGPPNQRRDRVAYDRSVTKGLQEELLLNIVQLRFGDSLNFLITQQLITNYSYQKAIGLSLAGSPWDRSKAPDSNGIGVRGELNFSDNPTAIYQPLNGEQIANLILYPLNPLIVSAFSQGSTPIDMLFSLTLKSFGGLRNTGNIANQSPKRKISVEKFSRLLSILRELQRADAISFRRETAVPAFKNAPALSEHISLTFRYPGTPEIAHLQNELRDLLHLPAGLEEAEIIPKTGNNPGTPTQIPITTRSMLSILLSVAATIDVPPNAVKAGAVRPSANENPHGNKRIITVHCSKNAPPASDIFVSVHYDGYTYWISQNDLLSKKAFSLLQIINNLTINRQGKGAQVTIPVAGR